jgi:hypothetical protein
MRNRIPNILSSEEAMRIAADAYVYGYPLVLMDVTRTVQTATASLTPHKAAMNQFLHLRQFPDPSFTDVVSANVDTLYSMAWIDVLKEPMVLSLPEISRYYLMQMLDAWTNVFASPGTRTTGNGKGDFAIAGPWWRGSLPQGMRTLHSTTRYVWIIGRTQTNGENDYAAVHSIQDQYRLQPLGSWGKTPAASTPIPYDSSIDAKTPPVEQVDMMSTDMFFRRLNTLMKDNPPAMADSPVITKFASVGVGAGVLFSMDAVDSSIREGINQGVEAGKARIFAAGSKPHGRKVNGWEIMPENTANFGTDYMYRAVVAHSGLGANLPDDALYPRATSDSQRQPLTGKNSYTLQFAKGEMPPVNAFWSITAYNSRQFFEANPINRYAIGDRDKLTFNPDGSLTIYISHDAPGPEENRNWLPVPAGPFNLVMRLYWPKKEILNGSWKIPRLERMT